LDGDGLRDPQEAVLGTLVSASDSDGDGYRDAEELARGTDPLNPGMAPLAPWSSVGMTARSRDGVITLVSVLFVHDTSFLSVRFELGVVVEGVAIRLPPWTYAGISTYAIRAAHNPADTLIVMETPVPVAILTALGSLSIYAKTVDLNAPVGHQVALAAVNLVSFSGVPVLIEPGPGFQQGGGLVYRPIAPGDEVPSTWSGGQVCYQSANPVGASGSSVVMEIEAASCQPMDSYCSASDCGAAVGGTIRIVDPGALIGG
jgi:hypothetical protein